MSMEEDCTIVNNSSSLFPALLFFFFLIGKLKPLSKCDHKLAEISSQSPLLNPSLPKEEMQCITITVNSM